MSDAPGTPNDPLHESQPAFHDGSGQGFFSEQIWHPQVGARVPEGRAQGVYCMGAIVLEGPHEFVIDFVQNLTRPPRVGARVIMNPAVLGQFVAGLRDNLQKYEHCFGPPKPMPRPPVPRRPSVKEIYGELRLGDDELSGHYATTALIGHSPAEFFFDFITRFFPTAAVSCRVYVSASNVPGLLETMTSAVEGYRRRSQASPGGPAGPNEPPADAQDVPPAPGPQPAGPTDAPPDEPGQAP